MSLSDVWSRWKRYWGSLPGKDKRIAMTVASSLIFALVMTSYITGYSSGHDVGNRTGYQAGFDAGLSQGKQVGFQDGKREAYSGLENGDPVVVFRQKEWLTRAFAVAFPSKNLSYGCTFSRESEVMTGNWTFMYDNKTKCRFFQGDLSEKWNDPAFEDKVIGNQVNTTSKSESNAT